MAEQRDNSGVLFKNDKEENPSWPDYKGWGMVDGLNVWISAWVKEGKKGKFMSLSFKAKDEQGKEVTKPAPEPTSKINDFVDDDIPF